MQLSFEITQPSSDVERWLNSRFVTYELRKIPLSSIDIQASRHNQARHEAITEARVQRFIRASRGDAAVFPALVVYETPSGRYVLIDGNNRQETFSRLGVEECLVYVVRAHADVLATLTAEANERNGDRPTRDESLQSGKRLVEQHHYTLKEAAQHVGLSHSDLGRYVRVEQAASRAYAAGIRGFHNLAESTKQRLSAIDADPAFRAATQLTIRAKLSIAEVSEMVTNINAARDDQMKLAAVAAVAERVRRDNESQKPRGSGGRNAWWRAKGALTTLLKLDITAIETAAPSDAARKEFHELARRVSAHLKVATDADA